MDDEKGIVADAVFFSNYVESRFVPQLRGSVDFGVPLPWAHSSVWLRNAAGIAKGEANDVYANFFFGGFGNNRDRPTSTLPRVDSSGSIQRAERGAVRAQHGGGKPPALRVRVRGHAFFSTRVASPRGVPSPLRTNRDLAQSGRRANAGGQVDLRFTVMHWYEMTLSVGYAVGYRGSERAGHEWMVSLKIM